MRLISYAILLAILATLPFVLPLYLEGLVPPGEVAAAQSTELANLMRMVHGLPLVIALILFVEGLVQIRERRVFGKEREALIQRQKDDETLAAENEKLCGEVAKLREMATELDHAKAQEADLQRALLSLKRELEEQRKKSEARSEVEAEVVALLSMLQKKGRLIDFLMDDITKYPDGQVGAAARIVHQGCASVLKDYFAIEPVDSAKEGSAVVVRDESDLARYRLLGKTEGVPPFNGRLVHRGWVTTKVSLPRLGQAAGRDARVIAPAEVEVK